MLKHELHESNAKVIIMGETNEKSFKGWDVIQFFKGRRKMIVTLLAGIIGYIVTDSELAAILAGAFVECGFAIAEYYYKE